jgi:O-antigen/teichoic acid export membrane protein
LPPGIARAWLASLSGQAIQLVLQTASFVLLARFLGAETFGLKVGLGALAAMAAPLAGFGFGNLLVRNVARQPAAFAESWGNALVITGAGGVALGLACVPIAWAVLAFPLPASVLAAVFLSDLALARVVALVGTAFQARGRIAAMARTGTTLQAARLCAVMVCIVVSPAARLEWWAMASLVASLGAAAATVCVAGRDLGRPAVSLARMRSEWREGLPFVLSPYTQAVSNDADKIVLGRFALPQAVGAYGAAYRTVSVACVPLFSLLAVTYPLFFQHGTRGIGASRRFARGVASYAVGAGLAATLAVLLAGHVVVKVLGAGFEDTAVILRWLCVLPTLRAIQFLFADALTGAGLQATRIRIQAAVAGLNVILNLALVPWLGWAGAIGSALASDVILAVALGAVTLQLERRAEGAG